MGHAASEEIQRTESQLADAIERYQSMVSAEPHRSSEFAEALETYILANARAHSAQVSGGRTRGNIGGENWIDGVCQIAARNIVKSMARGRPRRIPGHFLALENWYRDGCPGLAPDTGLHNE
jgi:hypothetical protein